jgi:hypothetical protein
MSEQKNGLTVHYNGEDRFIELSNDDASYFMRCVESSTFEPIKAPAPIAELNRRNPDWQQDAEKRMTIITSELSQKDKHFKRLEDLFAHHERTTDGVYYHLSRWWMVVALLDLIDFGCCNSIEEDNWVMNHLDDLLGDIIRDDPAGANRTEPIDALARLAFHLHNHDRALEEARDLISHYGPVTAPPELAPPAPLEPATAAA